MVPVKIKHAHGTACMYTSTISKLHLTKLSVMQPVTNLGFFLFRYALPWTRYGVPEPYEKLKAFTRGQKVTQQSMQEFVETLDGLPAHAKVSGLSVLSQLRLPDTSPCV